MDPGISHERAEAVFDAARDLGAGWVRIGFIWALAEPSPGGYNFAEFDWIVDAARRRGLRPLPVVIFTPRWAAAKPEAADYYAYPPATTRVSGDLDGYQALGRFAATVSKRYRGRVTYWELWNEPDMGASLHDGDGDGSSADEYARMLAYFARGLRSGNPEARVVLGGLAQGPAALGCETGYLEKLLDDPDHPALESFDVLNFHTNFLDMAGIKERIEANLRVLASHGAKEKPFWITETSYTSDPHFQSLAGYQGGGEALARYVSDALTVELEAGAEVAFWAALFDYGPDRSENDPYKHSGLYTFDLDPKPAAASFSALAGE